MFVSERRISIFFNPYIYNIHGRHFLIILQWGSCYSIFIFLCNVLSFNACHFVLLLLSIILPVLRITILIIPLVSATYFKSIFNQS